MQLSRVYCVLQIFLLAVSTSAEVQCTLSGPIALENNLSLQQVKNDADGTYTMKLAYTGGQSWVGIGINKQGKTKMVPGNAVIGRVNNDGSTSVLEYDLVSDAKDASGVQPVATQTLTDATFEQNGSTSTLTFTQVIDPSFLTDSALWIYAVGLPNNSWAGKHTIHGAFQLPLTSNCVEVATPVAVPTSAPVSPTNNSGQTAAPVMTPPVDDGDGDENETEAQDDESMSDEDNVDLNATGATNGDSSTISGFKQLNNSEDPSRSLWAAHGIVLSIAWGIFTPLAIGASLLRKGLAKVGPNQKGLWFQIHFYLNVLTVLLTVTGVALGVAATAKQQKHHFDETHHIIGLIILVLVLLQSVSACFRPALPKTPEKTSTKDVEETPPGSTLAMSVEKLHEGAVEEAGNASPAEAPLSSSAAAAGTKSQSRIGWEYAHRFVGVFVLALSWYNCHTGFEELEHGNYWETEHHWDNVFWGVTGGIAATILLLTIAVRFID